MLLNTVRTILANRRPLPEAESDNRPPSADDAADAVRRSDISLICVGIISLSGYLGGILVYDNGIGVGRHRRRGKTPRDTIERSGKPIWLEVDGGIKTDNIADVARAGADTFVAGSAIFGSKDYAATIRDMRDRLAKVG